MRRPDSEKTTYALRILEEDESLPFSADYIMQDLLNLWWYDQRCAGRNLRSGRALFLVRSTNSTQDGTIIAEHGITFSLPVLRASHEF